MLIDAIQADIKEAMKARDAARLGVLRFLHSEAKRVGIDERRELDDALVIGVLQRLAKQRREGIDQFRKAGRGDLAQKEEAELAILESYLPSQATDAEIEAALRAVIEETRAASKKDMGRVMKAALERLQGRADGKRVQAAAARLLP